MQPRRRGLGPLFALVLAVATTSCGDDSAPGGPTTAASGEPTFPEKDWDAEAARLLDGPEWYRHAVGYEIFVRSFQDSDGDGIGDFAGLTSRLDYLSELGVDLVWLMPVTPTPFVDSGYDVSDYQDINPDYGSLEDFEAFVAAAHERGIRVVMDLVLNHTSDQHAWFEESRADATNPKADWYVWSDTPSSSDNGCGTQSPVFGDSAWAFDEPRGQYYFHRFYAGQPDLNYRNPEVVDATLDVARFWLDRGVDGFRCDVIGLLHESATACELLEPTKDYIRQLRDVVDGYGDRVLLAEPSDLTDASPYLGNGSDMFHMAFNFAFGYFWGVYFAGRNADPVDIALGSALEKNPPGGQDALVIGSHDVRRAFTAGLGDDTAQLRAAVIQLTAKGTPFLYYGEELALRPGSQQVVDLRDAQRTPMLWSAAPGYGFTVGTPWLAFGAEADQTNLDAERGVEGSMYETYRQLLALRRGRPVWGVGEAEILASDAPSVFAMRRSDDFMAYVVAVNLRDEDLTTTLEVPAIGEEPAAKVFGHGTLEPAGDRAALALPAKGAAIFRTR